jgi:hypothetical protein
MHIGVSITDRTKVVKIEKKVKHLNTQREALHA